LSTVVIADAVAAGLFLSALRAAAAEVSSRRTVVAVVGRCERLQPAFGDPRQTQQPTELRQLHGGVLRDRDRRTSCRADRSPD
jgi:hypothetical protein